MMNMKPGSLHLNVDPAEFAPAAQSEKESLATMRESVGFWKDGFRRLRRNPIAMVSLVFIVIIMLFAFVGPEIYPYSYEEQLRGSENLAPFQYSASELARIEAGESVFPHILGTDGHARDIMCRLMMGTRISLLVGLVASLIILIIGSIYGSIAGYFGGKVDIVMMRIVDMIYTVPDILIIILLSITLRNPLQTLADTVPFFGFINTIGVPLICVFIVFSLLYWVGMARMVRSQILMLKEQEYVTAARALGASSGRIIKKHLLTNCIGTLIIMTTLQIPSSIFTESFLGFIGIGVSAPMPSLGSMASQALSGINTYPLRLLAPAIMISLVILSFNLFGDGLRDAFDPKLKN